MYKVIFILTTLFLSGCAGKGASVKRSDLGSQAADSAVQRVYSDMARPPVTVQVDRNVIYQKSGGR